MDRKHRQNSLFRQVLELDVDIDGAELVALAFIDGEGNDETVPVGGQLGDRRNYPEIGIALRQIVFAQQLAVIGDAVGIVGVRVRQEAVPAALLGVDDPAQRRVAELLVTDEIDAAHAGRRALVDLEDQIDAVLRQLDDLGLDRRGEPFVTPIEVEDALHIGLHPGAGVDDARAQLDFAVKVLVTEL
jgi:hypothetical protein